MSRICIQNLWVHSNTLSLVLYCCGHLLKKQPGSIKQWIVVQNTGLYYDQYLQKVVRLLESDESFKKKMETADFDDIRVSIFFSWLYWLTLILTNK